MTDTPVNTWELAQKYSRRYEQTSKSPAGNYHTGKGWTIRHH